MNETMTPLAPKKHQPAANGNVERSTSKVSAGKTAEAHLRADSRGDWGISGWDFSVRLPTDWAATEGLIAGAFNQAIAQKQRASDELTRLSETVGKKGRLRQRMTLPGAIGGWARDADSMNTLIDDLVRPTTETARTIGAVAKGDLGQSMDLEVDGRPLKGEFLRSAKLVNTMIEQLSYSLRK
jgi:methyl-accepting chemotaxis protein